MNDKKNHPTASTYSDSICFRISAMARRISRMHNKACSEFKITAGQSFILFDLLEHTGSSMTEISNRVQLDTPAVTGYIDRLIKENLVVRVDDPKDRRLLRISLTDKGEEIAHALLPKTKAVHDHIADLLGERDFDVFERCMTALEKGL